jgi:hypothetical protein
VHLPLDSKNLSERTMFSFGMQFEYFLLRTAAANRFVMFNEFIHSLNQWHFSPWFSFNRNLAQGNY